MQIETHRLLLRGFLPEDDAGLHEILGDAEVMALCEPPYDFHKTEEFLSSFYIGQQRAIAAVHKESGKLIGYLLFSEAEAGIYELGWFLNRRYWRQGYAYEACRAVIGYAFSELNARKVFAETIDTEKSVGLMRKLGMQFEGIEPAQPTGISDNRKELYLYAITKAD